MAHLFLCGALSNLLAAADIYIYYILMMNMFTSMLFASILIYIMVELGTVVPSVLAMALQQASRLRGFVTLEHGLLPLR